MKKLKEVTWKKCENSNELLQEMIDTYKVLRFKYNFYFNDQQHEIADIKRTLKNHNDWCHRMNCYYNFTNYYMVVYMKDKISVIYCDNILNNRSFGYVFLNKIKKELKSIAKLNEENKINL